MNEDRFAKELAKLLTGYWEGRMEKDQEEQLDESRLNLIRSLRNRGEYDRAIDLIMENPIFPIEESEIIDNGDKAAFCEYLYENISKVYEELKVLSGLEK